MRFVFSAFEPALLVVQDIQAGNEVRELVVLEEVTGRRMLMPGEVGASRMLYHQETARSEEGKVGGQQVAVQVADDEDEIPGPGRQGIRIQVGNDSVDDEITIPSRGPASTP